MSARGLRELGALIVAAQHELLGCAGTPRASEIQSDIRGWSAEVEQIVSETAGQTTAAPRDFAGDVGVPA